MASWEETRQAKVDRRSELITDSYSFVPEASIDGDSDILQSTATDITTNIKSGQWTATAVVHAFIRSARRAHDRLNCLTEVLFREAVDTAQRLDEEFASTGKLSGPMHGVPTSIKDQIGIKGFDSTVGFTGWIGRTAEQDSTIVTILREAGAVIIAKTNVPQTMLAFECNNPLFGITRNPYNTEATCGGSTGGEAALLASNGSVCGIGSDIGGSLRIPAHYSGVYGLKSVTGRWTTHGCANPKPGFESVRGVLGPIARSMDDIETIARTVLNGQAKYWDQEALLPIPYRQVELPKKMKIGYYVHDNFAKTSPACERAVLEAVDVFRKLGHEVVEVPAPDFVEGIRVFSSLISADGFKTILSHLGKDPMEDALKLTTTGPRLPTLVRWIASWFLTNVLGDAIFGSILLLQRAKTAYEVNEWQHRKAQMCVKLREDWWGAQGFDCVIAPVQAIPAPSVHSTGRVTGLAVPTFYYNIVDATVGTIPITSVDKDIDALPKGFLQDLLEGYPATGSKLFNQALYQADGGKIADRALYQPEEMHGQPLGVQIIGPTYTDEKIIAVMRILDDEIKWRARFGKLNVGKA